MNVYYEELLDQFARGDTPPPGMALKSATYPGAAGVDPGDTHVLIDGDTTTTPVQSLIGSLHPNARVKVLFWPPHGAYVVGVFAARLPMGDGPWLDVAFNTGWGNLGGGAQDVQYRVDRNTVKLRGLATRTSGTSPTIFTLPAEYRPQLKEVFAVASDPANHSNVDVLANGDVQWFAGPSATAAYVSVSGISFDPYDFI